MAQRAPNRLEKNDSIYNRSKTVIFPYKPIRSVNDPTAVVSEYSHRHGRHPQLKSSLSCPPAFRYLSPDLLHDPTHPLEEVPPPAITDGRNNSETDSSLREEIVQLSAQTEVVNTLTESLENIFEECPTNNEQEEIFSPTSQLMCSFFLPDAKHPLSTQIEDSDFNSDFSTSREASPFNVSDSCSSMSASNSDFSSTEQKDSKPHCRKAKESWLKVRRMIMWSPFVQIYRKKYPWIQLAGHHGSFRQGREAGTILKKLCPPERIALEKLNEDPSLKEFVPVYSGVQTINGEEYIQMQDLLRDFDNPSLMDIKIGLRTFNEEEIVHSRHKTKWRKDLYDKMCAIDCNAPTAEEHELAAISKYRYMSFRESLTSTVDLGFRIEGIKVSNNTDGLSKDFKTLKDKDKIIECILEFNRSDPLILDIYICRLQELLSQLDVSPFVEKNQLVGTSILFVHSNETQPCKANLWMIDFGKTTPIPPRVKINHRAQWKHGNYEDGYLFGIEQLLDIFMKTQTLLLGETAFSRMQIIPPGEWLRDKKRSIVFSS